MSNSIFPEYIQRIDAQNQIIENIEQVKQSRTSRAFLLYGEGGRGKTVLQRNLPSIFKDRNDIKWVGPIDLDNIQFWSLNNIKYYLANVLNEECKGCFSDYQDLVRDYERYSRSINVDQNIDYDKLLEDEFRKAYKNFGSSSDKTIVLQLDTAEAVRGFDVFYEIIGGLKKMPKTLLLISGRPVKPNEQDHVVNGLEREPSMLYERRELEVFTEEESQRYLEQSEVFSGLRKNEHKKIVLFVQGHPLWLALTVYYLKQVGVPQTLSRYSLDELKKLSKDNLIYDEYISELLTPYKERTFWHEAILRLSILRQRMSLDVWKKIMEDVPFSVGVETWDVAWVEFKMLPWVRERADKRYVTLQDAFAEELAKRYVPKVDKNRNLRHALWVKADKVYSDLIGSKKKNLEKQPAFVDGRLLNLNRESPSLDLHLLRAAGLHYKMLADQNMGSKLFLDLAETSFVNNQRELADFLILEIQRFLPGHNVGVLEDVERQRLQDVQSWFDDNPAELRSVFDWVFELEYFLGRSSQKKNIERMVSIWKDESEKSSYIEGLIWLYTVVWREDLLEGLAYLDDALSVAEQSSDTKKYLPQIYYLFGFSYRTNQQLKEACSWLEKAIEVSREQKNREYLASALNLLAYIYATMGDTDASGNAGFLVRQALDIRQRVLDITDENVPEYRERSIDLGWSYNTLAEINRYRGKLASSQTFYLKSERIFRQAGYYEGQAIALQALSDTRRRIALAADGRGDDDQSSRYWRGAKESLEESLDIYSRYGLSRGLETAYRRYGRFLFWKPEPDYEAAEENYNEALLLAKEKDNILEIVECTQELIFLSAELGQTKEFGKWEQEIYGYQGKIWQWEVFPMVIKIAHGDLGFTNGKYEEAIESYLSGYMGLVKTGGYGLALYGMHRDRVFNNVEKVLDVDLRRKLLTRLRDAWKDAGLDEKFSGFIKHCELQLLTIDLF